jgi:hypothetical protein
MSKVLELFDPYHTAAPPMRCRVIRWCVWIGRDTKQRWTEGVLAALRHQFGPNLLDGGAA